MNCALVWIVLLAAAPPAAKVQAPPAPVDELAVLPKKPGAVEPQKMLHAHLLRRAGEAFGRHDVQYEKLKTPEELAAYQRRMREFFFAQLGVLPARTPLGARVVGRVTGDGYHVERVIFESQPRHYVTAALYLPERGKPPYPGVLVPCGHSANGKAVETYQRACMLLARNGMVALCYDPIDQGERIQLLKPDGRPVTTGTTGHCLLSVGSMLLGRNTATYRVWDGFRAIDYLAGRPEVDAKRLGCTGNSGGGTLTSYLMALDERIWCAAPSCYLTSMRRLMETIGPQDGEQNIHAQIAGGLGHLEYILIRSPKPTLMCTATRDFFDIAGAWDTFRRAKRWYTRQGFSERIDLVEADEGHGFSSPLRTAAVRWMRRWLLDAHDPITEDVTPPILSDRQLQCTETGQVMKLPGARSVYDLNTDLETRFAAERRRFWRENPAEKALAEVRRLTGIRPVSDLPALKCEVIGRVARSGYTIEKLILWTATDIGLPALLFQPERLAAEAYLWLNGDGKRADALPGGELEKLVRQGHRVLAVDLRGLGEMQRVEKSAIAQYAGPEWRDVYLACMLDTSCLAMWCEDLLACGRFLASYGGAKRPRKVHLVAIGRPGPAALHAAALEPDRFASVRLQDCLRSWAEVVRAPTATDQMINCVHGALQVYDLPDLAATLPKDRLTLLSVSP